MRVSCLLLFLLLLPFAGLFAQFTASFNPGSIQVNTMSITSFDPNDPESQPLLTALTVNYNGAIKPRMDIKVRVVWNNQTLAEADFQSQDSVNPQTMYPEVFTSRQLISNDGHPDFEKKPFSPDISFEEIADSPTFGDAVLSGYFPDGKLEFRIWVRPYSTAPWDEPSSNDVSATYTINIRNAGTITLLSPGAQIGQTPTQISNSPVSFLWNNVDTGFNNYSIEVKEFAESNPPTINTVASTGTLIYQGSNAQSGDAPYIPFTVGRYYAWQVSTDLSNEFNPHRTTARTPVLKSNWFVFKYVNEGDASQGISELQAQLNLLNNSELRSIYNAGFNTVGTVIFEGRTYSGQDAIDLVESLSGKEIQVQLKN